MATNEVELDPILKELGPLGRFACVQTFLFCLGYFSDAHQLFSFIFTAKRVKHTCAPPPDGNGSAGIEDFWLNSSLLQYSQCAIHVTNNVSGDFSTQQYPCLFGMSYEEPRERSIVSEFDLVCERAPLAGLTQTLMTFGTGIGAIVFPWLSDLYGRRRIIMLTSSLTLAITLVAGFAPNYYVFAATKFLLGALASGLGLIGMVAAIEMYPSTHRALVGGFGSTCWWGLCICSLAPIAYLLRYHPWRHLQIAISGSSSMMILIILFSKEPIRWLMANGKIAETEKVLKQAAKWNRKDPQAILELFRSLIRKQSISIPVCENGIVLVPDESTIEVDGKVSALIHTNAGVESSVGEKESMQEKLSFLDLFRHPLLRKNAMVSWFIWFVDSFTYFALYLMSNTLALNLYVSFFLNGLVEGASCILMIIMLHRLGRKPVIGIFQGLTGIGLIMSSICFSFQDNNTLQILGTVVSLCSKMCLGGAFNLLFLYTPEIFPTNIRNRALGVSLAGSTIGGMVAPFAGLLAGYAVWLPGAVFGICNLLAVFLLIPLPESRGKELPQNTRDLEAWYQSVPSKEPADSRKATSDLNGGVD